MRIPKNHRKSWQQVRKSGNEIAWGSTGRFYTNERRECFLDFILNHNLSFMNKAFVVSNRTEVLDITLVSAWY